MNKIRAQVVSPAGIPAELQRSTPRGFRLTAMGRLTLGAAIVFVLGAVAFSVGAFLSAARAKALMREMAEHGQLASGVVVKAYRTGDDDKRDVFLYEFVVADKTYNGRTKVRVRNSPHYRAGASIPVRYLPAQPEKNWIDGYPPGAIPLFVTPLVAGALLIGGYSVFRKLRCQEELVSEGRAALARVTVVKRVRRGEYRKQRAHIEFGLMSGARQEAYLEFGKNAPAPDSTIVIVYDRENPRRVLRYPACLVRVQKPGEW